MTSFYPLIHPTWIFMQIFGDTVSKLIEDERRFLSFIFGLYGAVSAGFPGYTYFTAQAEKGQAFYFSRFSPLQRCSSADIPREARQLMPHTEKEKPGLSQLKCPERSEPLVFRHLRAFSISPSIGLCFYSGSGSRSGR